MTIKDIARMSGAALPLTQTDFKPRGRRSDWGGSPHER